MLPALGKKGLYTTIYAGLYSQDCTYLYWAFQGYLDLYKNKQGYTSCYYHGTFCVIDRECLTTHLQDNALKRVTFCYLSVSRCAIT